VLLLA